MTKIIIDANVASEFSDRTPEARAISVWLRTKGFLSTGGLNLTELNKTGIRKFVIELIRAGRGTISPATAIEAALKDVQAISLASDDPHILALALAGSARLLYTRDEALMKDFKDRNIINNPRGSCYRDATRHKRLLA